MRMERYEETNDELNENKNLSRLEKNKDIYRDIYTNSSYVEFSNILNIDEPTAEIEDENIQEKEKIDYEQKNYNINDYIEKAHENIKPDSDIRSLSNQEFIEGEDEISSLIKEIDEKGEDEDFFEHLKGDNEDTMIKGQLIDEKEITYKEIFSTSFLEEEAKLDKALGSETMTELKLEEEGISNTFQDILKNEGFSSKKKRKIAIIFFSITLFALITVILIIVFK